MHSTCTAHRCATGACLTVTAEISRPTRTTATRSSTAQPEQSQAQEALAAIAVQHATRNSHESVSSTYKVQNSAESAMRRAVRCSAQCSSTIPADTLSSATRVAAHSSLRLPGWYYRARHQTTPNAQVKAFGPLQVWREKAERRLTMWVLCNSAIHAGKTWSWMQQQTIANHKTGENKSCRHRRHRLCFEKLMRCNTILLLYVRVYEKKTLQRLQFVWSLSIVTSLEANSWVSRSKSWLLEESFMTWACNNVRKPVLVSTLYVQYRNSIKFIRNVSKQRAFNVEDLEVSGSSASSVELLLSARESLIERLRLRYVSYTCRTLWRRSCAE